MTSWKQNVRQVVPYTPGEQPKQQNIIKLNTNENPYPPSPRVSQAIAKVSADSLRRYPERPVVPFVFRSRSVSG